MRKSREILKKTLLTTLIFLLLALSGCGFEKVQAPPKPVYPEGMIIGPDGPEPMRGWEVVSKRGKFDNGDYFDTGGQWYISLEFDALLETEYTQVYINPDADSLGNAGWTLHKNFRVSHRFLYIDDPMKNYLYWDYVLFIYLDYISGGT